MYDLTIGLTYNEPLKLDYKFRYDFVCFDLKPTWGNGPLNGSIFVFRTITRGEVAGNVLVDLIDHSNVNAFDVALHGNAHFHMLEIDRLCEHDTFPITDNILIQLSKNAGENTEFHALIKEQKYESNRDDIKGPITFKEIKYLLFTNYHEDVANMKGYHLAPIFNLQREVIWHQNRSKNFNDLTKLDIDKYVNDKLDPNTPWNTVKEIVENEREKWRKQANLKFHELLNAREELHDYSPLER